MKGHRPALLSDLARHRLWDRANRVPEDHRTPEERSRDNEELLRALAKVVKPEVFGRIAELFTVGGRITDEGNWIDLLESRLDQETFGDVIDAFLSFAHDTKDPAQ